MDWRKPTLLVTGGTGSFGRKFVELALRELHPARLIIYSRDEWKQSRMRSEGLDDPRLRYFIGDVRDERRLFRALDGVDVVVHAAALKQIPACEYNPIEAVETNIGGARRLIDAALDRKVSRVLALSSDKAAAPLNLYGATKLVAEKLFVHANAYVGKGRGRFSCVRYGNVIGSRGSVVELFRDQRRTGTLTVTDARMTRFWITLEQGVRFVISCLKQMRGGEVFIPKLPSMKVLDLAQALAPECKVNFIGIRPGEKLHESLLSADESREAVELDDRFVLAPLNYWGARDYWRKHGRALPEGFSFASDTNRRRLTPKQMLELLDG
jgi:UDP-N-acetylglucosamine 4,6-dehydratase